MELNKIAQNEEMTYLEKVAAIVDEFAAGNVGGEDADSIAQEAGISPEDLLSVYNAAYGEADMEKVASADEMTYLQKVASVVDSFAADEVTAQEVAAIADEHGLSLDDIESVSAAAYGDIEKTAMDQLEKIASDENSTYLMKCASIADTFAAGEITGDEADQIATDLGLAPADVLGVFSSAYPEALEKEAGVKEAAKGAADFFTKDFKSGASKYGIGSQKAKAGKESLDAAKQYGNKGNHKFKKTMLEGEKLKGEGAKELATGTAKVVGTAGTGALAAKGLFGGGKKDD